MIIHEGSTSEKKYMVFIGETIRISVMGFYSFFQQDEQPVCCGAGEALKQSCYGHVSMVIGNHKSLKVIIWFII